MKEIKAIIRPSKLPTLREKLRGLNIDARSSTPEQTAALLAADIRRWSGVIERANIQKQ